MRNSVRLLVFLFMMLLSPFATSYMIENNTKTGTFYGQFCASCWHGSIPKSESRGCPGNAQGCRNQTWIYKHTGVFRLRANSTDDCYATGRVPVTAHGRVVFNSDGIEIYNDQGALIDKGSYVYYSDSGLFNALREDRDCQMKFYVR